MRRYLAPAAHVLALLLAVALTLPLLAMLGTDLARAHHAEVAEPASDAEALAVFVSEFDAQHEPLVLLIRRYLAAPVTERATQRLELERAIATTIDHVESLPPARPCFAILAGLGIAQLHAIRDWLLTIGPSPPMAAAHLDHAASLNGQMARQLRPSLIDCAPEVTP